MRYSKAFIFAAILFAGVVTASAQEQESTTDAVKFSEELNKLRLFDLSQEVLDRAIRTNPPDVERLRIQKAATYFKERKGTEGDAIMRSISPSSPYFSYSRKTQGQVAMESGEYAKAASYFEEYRAGIKQRFATAIPTEDEMVQIEQDYTPLLAIYRQYLPNREKMMQVMRDVVTLRARLTAEQNRISGDNQTGAADETILVMYRNVLDMCEEDQRQGKPISNSEVQRILKDGNEGLEVMMGKTNNFVRDLCAVQIARCHLLLGDVEKAEKILKNNETNFEEWDIPDPETNELPCGIHESPRAGYRHYYAKIKILQAKKMMAEGKADEAKAAYAAAMNHLLNCIRNYKGYPYSQEVIEIFDDLNEKVLPPIIGKVPFNPQDPILEPFRVRDSISDKAQRALDEKRYDEAIPMLLSGYAQNPNCSRASACLSSLADCYLKTEQLLLAQVIADLMANRFPNDDRTAAVLYAVGNASWSDANKNKTDRNYKNLLANAVLLLNRFVELFPAHNNAPNIVFNLANASLAEANDLMRQGNSEIVPVRKVAMHEKGRKLYMHTAELYKNIVEKFAQKPDLCARAYYSMGNCYSYAFNYPASTAAFQKYGEMCKAVGYDKLPEKDMLALAKSRTLIADNYFRDGDLYSKKIKELRPKIANMTDTDAVKANENIAQMTDSMMKNYMASATAYEDFVNNFYPYILKNSKNPEFLQLYAQAQEFCAWRYDCAEKKDIAIKKFEDYLRFTSSDDFKLCDKLVKTKDKDIPVVLSRISILYTELKNPEKAAEYLTRLTESYPNSEEAQSAQAILGKSMFSIKHYDRACEAFNEMFVKNQAKVSDCLWIINNMLEYPDRPTVRVDKAMAEVAVKAGEMLLSDLSGAPKLSNWAGKERIKQIKKDKAAVAALFEAQEERVRFLLGKSLLFAEKYQEAIKMLTPLLPPAPEDKFRKYKTSAYIFDAYMLRAEAYHRSGEEVKAHQDLNKITTMASVPVKDINGYDVVRYDILRKALCMAADFHIESKNYKECASMLVPYVSHGALNERAEVAYPEDASEEVKKYIDEAANDMYQEEMKYMEYMCWKYAQSQALLGDNEKRDDMVNRYRQYFPAGRYSKEMNNLPAKDADSKP